MSKRLFNSIGAFGSLCWALSSTPQAISPRDSRPVAESAQTFGAILNRYCVTCHNDRLKTGGLALDVADSSRVPMDAEGGRRWCESYRRA